MRGCAHHGRASAVTDVHESTHTAGCAQPHACAPVPSGVTAPPKVLHYLNSSRVTGEPRTPEGGLDGVLGSSLDADPLSRVTWPSSSEPLSSLAYQMESSNLPYLTGLLCRLKSWVGAPGLAVSSFPSQQAPPRAYLLLH